MLHRAFQAEAPWSFGLDFGRACRRKKHTAKIHSRPRDTARRHPSTRSLPLASCPQPSCRPRRLRDHQQRQIGFDWIGNFIGKALASNEGEHGRTVHGGQRDAAILVLGPVGCPSKSRPNAFAIWWREEIPAPAGKRRPTLDQTNRLSEKLDTEKTAGGDTPAVMAPSFASGAVVPEMMGSGVSSTGYAAGPVHRDRMTADTAADPADIASTWR